MKTAVMPELLIDPVETLNRVLQTLLRSLPAYLDTTGSWCRRDPDQLGSQLTAIAANQRILTRRIASAILNQNGKVSEGQFPAEFTFYNDLDTRFLLNKTIALFEKDIETLGHCETILQPYPDLQALASEALGNLRGHLDTLLNLA
jgi:hypothetical protein